MKKRRKVNGEKLFSVIITCAIILTLAIGVISVIKNSQKNTDNPENIVDLNETKENNFALNNQAQDQKEESTQKAKGNDLALENKKEEKPSVKETEPATEVQTKKNENKAVASPTGASAKYSFGDNDTLKWPVKGDVLLKYSMDSTIYFKTLGQYKTNPAIVIGADVGTPVTAAASGVVESVTKNEETGTTITVNIGNDYITTYGQLDNVTLKKGTAVVAGDKIGTVATPTKYYTGEGTNLYFKLTKAGSPVDPTMHLEQD